MLEAARAAARSRMTASVVIDRAGAPTFDLATGGSTAAWTVVYEGCANVTPKATSRDVSEGGGLVLVQDQTLRIPVDAAAVKPGDRVRITAVDDDADAVVLDISFEVEAVEWRTTSVQRRLNLTASTGANRP
jgi:hypothetical protein